MKAIIIILISLVAIGLVVLFFIRKAKKAKAEEKKQDLERVRKRKAEDKANLERWKGIYSTISITKLPLPDDLLLPLALFEDWDYDEIFAKHPTDGHWRVIKEFLKYQKELQLIVAKNENAFLEFKAYSNKFLEKWIGRAKEKEGRDKPGDFWTRFFSNIYEKDFIYVSGKACSDIDVKTNHELFFDLMLADVEDGIDSTTLRATMNDIDMFLHVYLFVPRLESSDLYKKLMQKEKDLDEEKFKIELEEFRTNGVIDEKLLTFIKTHPNPTDRLLAREVFDEIVLKDLKRKFFPDQDLSSISQELAIKLAQAYLNFTLKMLE